jgi:hypothetical protein
LCACRWQGLEKCESELLSLFQALLGSGKAFGLLVQGCLGLVAGRRGFLEGFLLPFDMVAKAA